MKKLFSILLVAMLIVTSLATVAFAAEPATVSASSVTAKAGDEVTITFTLSCDQFATYGMKITADPVLKLTGIQQGGAFNGSFVGNLDNGVVGFGATSNCSGGVIFTATFKVAADAQPGKYPVSVIVDNVCDEDANRLNVSVAAGYVTVVCDHSWSAWRTVETPTCTKEGKAERTCSVCKEVESKVLPVVAHNWSAWQTVEAPTCTKAGKAERTCSVGGEKETKVLPVVDHNWSAWQTVEAPTCTKAGKAERTCSVGGEKETKVLPALGHEAATDWSYDETNHWHACCNGCDKIYDLGAHELEWVITKNPTNSTTGLKHQECKICGYKLSDVEIPVDPDLDDVPGTGDITPMVHAAVLVILGVVFAIAFLVKRMFTRHQF